MRLVPIVDAGMLFRRCLARLPDKRPFHRQWPPTFQPWGSRVTTSAFKNLMIYREVRRRPAVSATFFCRRSLAGRVEIRTYSMAGGACLLEAVSGVMAPAVWPKERALVRLLMEDSDHEY
jgi:hypothetical protein